MKITQVKCDLCGDAGRKPKRMRLCICPKCLYRLAHWDEAARREEMHINRNYKEGVEK